MCPKLGEMQLFVEKYHADTMLENRAVHIFNNKAMMHFIKILQRRQKATPIGQILVKKATADEEESTANKRQRMGKSPKG